MEKGEELPEHVGVDRDADASRQPERRRQSDHPPAAAPQTVEKSGIQPPRFAKMASTAKMMREIVQTPNALITTPLTSCHVTEFAFVVERGPVVESQIAEVGDVRAVDEVLHRRLRPAQAVFFGEAVFVCGEVGHIVFDGVEDGREQDAQCRADEGDGGEKGDKVGEEGFHRISDYVIARPNRVEANFWLTGGCFVGLMPSAQRQKFTAKTPARPAGRS